MRNKTIFQIGLGEIFVFFSKNVFKDHGIVRSSSKYASTASSDLSGYKGTYNSLSILLLDQSSYNF